MKLRVVANLRIVGRPEPGDYEGKPTYKLNILTDEGAGDLKCSCLLYTSPSPRDCS